LWEITQPRSLGTKIREFRMKTDNLFAKAAHRWLRAPSPQGAGVSRLQELARIAIQGSGLVLDGRIRPIPTERGLNRHLKVDSTSSELKSLRRFFFS
jgi:hypothetical protein